jgi:antitoxin component YwqK of YwqJK toxin-antitoxin module
MILINSGTFRMGDLNDLGSYDEKPVHQVTISRPFYVSEREITINQYCEFNKEFKDEGAYHPYATGMSWYDAEAFCRWLSDKEGKTYRLPTEAEWEYVCRAGTETPYSSGAEPPDHETQNNWGVRNMHSGVLEWCYDWYGSYPHHKLTDPVGISWGFGKVLRGGLPDDKILSFEHPNAYYTRSANRASLGPNFKAFVQDSGQKKKKTEQDYDQFMPGLTGILYDDAIMKKPLSLWRAKNLNSNDLSWKKLNDWSVRWRGSIYAPATGNINFHAEADNGIKIKIGDQIVIDGWGLKKSRDGTIKMELGKKYPIEVSYFKDRGDSYMRVYWSWRGQSKIDIPADALEHNRKDHDLMENTFYAAVAAKVSAPSIGFRIVQSDQPATKPLPYEAPYVFQGIKEKSSNINLGPDLKEPYFRKRHLLPIPPENSEKDVINAAGLDQTFFRHIHDPGFAVCDNGDLLTVLFTSIYEDEPEVSLLAVRLRYGADQWDMPSPFIDQADVNDVAPMLWNDNGKLKFYFGNIHLDSAYPFQWTTSPDNGATWSDINYPNFKGTVGPHTAQPINSAFRDAQGNVYIACDGLGATSVLYTTPDEGKTWYDHKGRSGGRHTTFVQLKDGTIIGMGGKHSDIDGYMPKSISKDGGRTWKIEKTPFPSLGTNQRPTIVRLSSGRLFMAGDFQRIDGIQPAGIKQRGSYAALSSDEGKTWLIKKIPGGQVHESKDRQKTMKGETLGYAVAKQSQNGIIHLIATMTHPCLHFEFNEAWILKKNQIDKYSESELMASNVHQIKDVKKYEETFPNGQTKIVYHAGRGDDGRSLLHGAESWFYPNGSKHYAVTYHLGRKKGLETYWNLKGVKIWEWNHEENNKSRWTQWWPNGVKKAESHWIGKVCHGQAKTWDREGSLITDVIFKNGIIAK